MQALAIVEDFEIVERRCPGLVAGTVARVMDLLGLERGEDALHGCIIEAVAAPAHGLDDAMPLQHGPVRFGGVLDTE